MHSKVRDGVRAAAVLVAATVTVTACGAGTATSASDHSQATSTAGTTSTTSKASATSPHAQNGIAATDAALKLGAITHTIPADWVSHTENGISYAMPPMSDISDDRTAPDSNGALQTFWSGPPIPGALSTRPDGWQVGMSLIMSANPKVQWDGRIRDGHPNTFTAQLTGASVVGGSIVQTDAAVSKSGETRPLSDISIYIQGASGRYYEATITTSPGDAGIQFLRQFLGTIAIQ